MNKWSELFIGLILLIGVILVAWASSAYNWTILGKDLDFLHSAWVIFKGILLWGVFFIGVFLIILGINDLKN